MINDGRWLGLGAAALVVGLSALRERGSSVRTGLVRSDAFWYADTESENGDFGVYEVDENGGGGRTIMVVHDADEALRVATSHNKALQAARGQGSTVRTALLRPSSDTITDLRFPGHRWTQMNMPSPEKVSGWARYDVTPKTVIAWGELQGPKPDFEVKGVHDPKSGFAMADFLASDLIRFADLHHKGNFRWPTTVGIFVSPDGLDAASRTVFLADTDAPTGDTSDYLMSVVAWVKHIVPGFARGFWKEVRADHATRGSGSAVRTLLREARSPGLPVRLLLTQTIDDQGSPADRIALQVLWKVADRTGWVSVDTVPVLSNFPRQTFGGRDLPDPEEIQKIFRQAEGKIQVVYRPNAGALINEQVLAEGDEGVHLPIAVGLTGKKPIPILVPNLLNAPPAIPTKERLSRPEDWIPVKVLRLPVEVADHLMANQIDPAEVPHFAWQSKKK